MASRTVLNAKNLETLGAAALAELLIEISTGSAAAKRRLRLALASGQGPQVAAGEIRKRLATLHKSRARIGWQQRNALADDLATQSRAILDTVAPADPVQALNLAWQFLALANPLFDRLDDSAGTIIALFQQMTQQLGPLAQAALTTPSTLADQALEAILANECGQYDGVIPALAPALGAEGLQHLRALITNLGDPPIPPKSEWRRVGLGPRGPVFAHQMEQDLRRRILATARQEIADATGDVDAFIDTHGEQARKTPTIAADIASRLMAAGRAEEALSLLDAADLYDPRRTPEAWHDARLSVLEALGRTEQAQNHRWQVFAQTLAPAPLRALLKKIPDFEDIEVLDRAMALVVAWPQANQALWFLVNWPALPQAAALVLDRFYDLDGDGYEILTPAAETLAPRYPLAAMLALRAMVDFALRVGRASRYMHVAGHLVDCASLDAMITDYADVESHHDYIARLRADHPRKSTFWDMVAQAGLEP